MTQSEVNTKPAKAAETPVSLRRGGPTRWATWINALGHVDQRVEPTTKSNKEFINHQFQ